MSGLQMKYFVLKPEGDDAYAEASREAMRTYALHIVGHNLNLADDLLHWLGRIKADRQQNEAAG